MWNGNEISYQSVPLEYRIWEKDQSKLKLAASMVRKVMPGFHGRKNVIILCDSWYVKKELNEIVKECQNLDLIGNARGDSICMTLHHSLLGTGEGQQNMDAGFWTDFILSAEMIGGYYIGFRQILTNIFSEGKFWPILHPQ